jgi:hypothetical protein
VRKLLGAQAHLQISRAIASQSVKNRQNLLSGRLYGLSRRVFAQPLREADIADEGGERCNRAGRGALDALGNYFRSCTAESATKQRGRRYRVDCVGSPSLRQPSSVMPSSSPGNRNSSNIRERKAGSSSSPRRIAEPAASDRPPRRAQSRARDSRSRSQACPELLGRSRPPRRPNALQFRRRRRCFQLCKA